MPELPQTFDGQPGTYSDHRCCRCPAKSPFEDKFVPWCERCQSWHGVEAEHINRRAKCG